MHKRTCRVVLSSTGLIAGLIAGFAGMAGAQAVPIATVACNDIAGLDAAIVAANAATGPSTIVLATGCVYTLTTAADTSGTQGPDGLPIITNTVTLIGNATIIQRDLEASDFRIAEVDTDGTLTVQGITVRFGSAEVGGCYLVTGGGALVLKHSGVAECEAGGGGGIALNESPPPSPTRHGARAVRADGVSTALISNSQLVGNSADDGGAILADSGSSLRLVTDYLAKNEAVDGGAIYTDGLQVFVGSSELTQNRAEDDGGAIDNMDSAVDVAGSKLDRNLADDEGGAIYNDASTLIENSSVVSNSAPAGGGIWQEGGPIVVIKSLIASNVVNNCAPLASVPGCFG